MFNKAGIRLSVSKIQTFEQCPFKWKLTYIDGFVSTITPPQLKMGKDIHSIFDEVLESAPTTIQELKEAVDLHPLTPQYKQHLDNFVKFNEGLIKEGRLKLPMYREVELFDIENNFIGVIDRVDGDGEEVVVIDYKTGKENSLQYHHFQLGVYKYLLEKLHKKKVTHWGIFYSLTGKLMMEESSEEVVQACLKRIKEAREKIMKEEVYPKKPSALCNYCEFFQNGCMGYIKDNPEEDKFWED